VLAELPEDVVTPRCLHVGQGDMGHRHLSCRGFQW
jgi:hypothetical protein